MAEKPLLLTPVQLADLKLRNRIVVAPMCQYQAIDGVPNDWHMAHLGRFAIGGAGLVIAEMSAIEPRGRITHHCAGIWNDEQARAWSRISDFLRAHGAASGIQIAHAGRKASALTPLKGGGPLAANPPIIGEPPWNTLGPSAIGFGDWPPPHALTMAEIAQQLVLWREAAQRALDAGFDLVELHGAHGYLIHEFLSPLSNHRTDPYGGDLQGRMRYPLEIVETVRAVWPSGKPLSLRISASDYVDGGWTPEDSVVLAREAAARGADIIHVTSGGNAPVAPAVTPGYQVPFSEQVRREAGVPTIAVGAIVTPALAEDVLQSGAADLVAIARAALDDPNWPLHARDALAPEAGLEGWSDAAVQGLARSDALMRRLGRKGAAGA
jgi:2,4-dienoyl-CoA reductase-like NADH-dependent reductase (Old Yellow Enzyme family)